MSEQFDHNSQENSEPNPWADLSKTDKSENGTESGSWDDLSKTTGPQETSEPNPWAEFGKGGDNPGLAGHKIALRSELLSRFANKHDWKTPESAEKASELVQKVKDRDSEQMAARMREMYGPTWETPDHAPKNESIYEDGVEAPSPNLDTPNTADDTLDTHTPDTPDTPTPNTPDTPSRSTGGYVIMDNDQPPRKGFKY